MATVLSQFRDLLVHTGEVPVEKNLNTLYFFLFGGFAVVLVLLNSRVDSSMQHTIELAANQVTIRENIDQLVTTASTTNALFDAQTEKMGLMMERVKILEKRLELLERGR